MTQVADTQAVDTTAEVPSAGTQGTEIQIPKWRFDEVARRAKQLEDQLEMKDQILQTVALQRQPQAQETELSAEELGLDPQSFQANRRLMEHEIQKRLRPAQEQMQRQMAMTANKTEELDFLIRFGTDKQRYLDKVREQRGKHYRETGGYMSVEDAYRIVRSYELEDRVGSAQPARQAAAPMQQQQSSQAQVENSYPSPELTRQAPGAAGSVAPKQTQDTLEDLEARLDEALRNSGSLV